MNILALERIAHWHVRTETRSFRCHRNVKGKSHLNGALTAIVVLCLHHPASSQILENSPFDMFNEIPAAEFRGYGMGSLGFDALMNIYNPHYWSLDGADYRFLVGAGMSVAGDRTRSPQDEIAVGGSREKFSGPVIPTIGILYIAGRISLQLCYSHDYNLRNHVAQRVTYIFQRGYSYYAVTSGEREVTVRQSTFQAATSFNVAPISLTAGLLTKSFRYTWDIKSIPPVVHGHDLLDQFQLFLGVMAEPREDLQAYASFISESPDVNISEARIILPIGTIVYARPATVSHYGNIGYGVQAGVVPRVKVSIEMRHQFLRERDIWNNEVTLGTRLSLLDDLQIGFRYSRFLKYDNRKGIGIYSSSAVLRRVSIANPYSLSFAPLFTVGPCSIEGVYQYSKSEYVYGDRPFISDAVHSAAILLGYSLSLEE